MPTTLKQIRADNARRQAEMVERRHKDGIYEVRGVWAPKRMHDALKAAMRKAMERL